MAARIYCLATVSVQSLSIYYKKKSSKLKLCFCYNKIQRHTFRDIYSLPNLAALWLAVSGCAPYKNRILQKINPLYKIGSPKRTALHLPSSKCKASYVLLASLLTISFLSSSKTDWGYLRLRLNSDSNSNATPVQSSEFTQQEGTLSSGFRLKFDLHLQWLEMIQIQIQIQIQVQIHIQALNAIVQSVEWVVNFKPIRGRSLTWHATSRISDKGDSRNHKP